MRCESAVDGRQLLSHKRREVDLALSRRGLLAGPEFLNKSRSRLPVAVSFDLAEETILGPCRYVSETKTRSGRRGIVKRRTRDRDYRFQLELRQRRVRQADVNHLPVYFQRA